MEDNEFEKVHIENRMCYYCFDIDNILIDEKSYQNILIYDI